MNYIEYQYIGKYQLTLSYMIINFRIFKFITLILILLLGTTASYAQKEGNIWYFGNNAGIDFNSGSPTVITNGALASKEGSSVISDNMGNLLFYTDGVTVWNKNHVRMPNGFGLMGDFSATQSTVIVSHPSNENIYYIFTVDSEEKFFALVNGHRYSVVDMTLQGGLGDVTTKNVLLHAPATEKLTAAKHSNGCDIWIITHEWGNNNFRAYLLDSSGVNTSPVITSIGANHERINAPFPNNIMALGQVKVSLDGKKLAIVVPPNSFELFDFDNTTGIISNPVTFSPTTGFGELAYGLEFSPDGTLLYGSTGSNQGIYQWNLLAGSSTDIINSQQRVGSTPGFYLGSLQLAPDGKIYVARHNTGFLGVINNPNVLGTACNYEDNGIFLGGRGCLLGLPTYMSNHFYAQFNYENICFGDTTFFFVTNTPNLDSVSWAFGDTTSGAFNTSTDLNSYHIFSAPGRYNVQMTKYAGCTSVFNKTLIIYPIPKINLGNDTLICPADSLILSAQTSGATYLWQDGSTNSDFTVFSPGTFWVEVTNACGSDIDSIDIGNVPFPDLNLGNDKVLCPGQSLILDAFIPGASYVWQDNSTDSVFTVSSAGFFWVEVRSIEGCSQSDSITTNYSVPPNIELGNDTLLCQGDELLLDVTTPGAAYQWQDNSTASSYTVTDPGFYYVQVTNADGCSNSDSVSIEFSIPPAVSLGNDTVLCKGQSLDLMVNLAGVTYTWQDGSSNSTFIASSSGLYWVEATNADGCENSDSVSVKIVNVKADFKYEEIPCTKEVQFINLSSGALSSYWDFGDGTESKENNPLHTYESNEKYRIILIINSDSTCTDTIQAVIPFENNAAMDTLFIPNVFTPNGDGKNDYFEITGGDTPCNNSNRLMIFNRWGEKVFETEGNELKWDGTKNGADLTVGVYFYVLAGEKLMKSGSLSLLK